MSDKKMCHKTIELEFDTNGNEVIIGAPCIQEQCEAWNIQYKCCNLSSGKMYISGVR